MKKVILSLAIAATAILTGCTDAEVASRNLSQAADQFEVNRRIVFYNGITNDYILTVEGLCSLGSAEKLEHTLTVTCKTGPAAYKKHYLGLSQNVTFIAEQLDAANVSAYHYRVLFKPSVIVPDIEVK